MARENFVNWLNASHRLKEQTEGLRRITMNEFTKFPDYLATHEEVIVTMMLNSAETTFAPLLNDAATALQDSMKIAHAMDNLVGALARKTSGIELGMARLSTTDDTITKKLDVLYKVTQGHDEYLEAQHYKQRPSRTIKNAFAILEKRLNEIQEQVQDVFAAGPARQVPGAQGEDSRAADLHRAATLLEAQKAAMEAAFAAHGSRLQSLEEQGRAVIKTVDELQTTVLVELSGGVAPCSSYGPGSASAGDVATLCSRAFAAGRRAGGGGGGGG